MLEKSKSISSSEGEDIAGLMKVLNIPSFQNIVKSEREEDEKYYAEKGI